MKLVWAFLGAALMALAADDAMGDTGLHQTPLGYQQITSLSSAQTLTVPTGATQAVIYVETQAVRYRDDGVAPTASVGAPLAVTGTGQPLVYTGTLSAIQFIEQTASAKIDILYYK